MNTLVREVSGLMGGPGQPEWSAEAGVELESGAEIKSWRHKASGARVRLISTSGPMVNLYAVVATEAVSNAWSHCDDGLPHTLEHLVFLGSKDYPYKGVLDKLANRCLARGTNAWTDVDHTAYTATTAGSKGLLALLPIYVDHILRPTLTEAGFLTEVHHVTGQGEDKGVVYCEMQGRETTAESVAERACLRALYPDPLCGYASETGGMCANLRDLTNAQVRRYHQEFYRPENLCLIVTGGVDPDALLQACDKALTRSAFGEKGVTSSSTTTTNTPDGQQGGDKEHHRERPWTREVAALAANTEKSTVYRVEFPAAQGEETGVAVFGWRGTTYGSYFEDAKQGLLWTYLTDGAAAPLTRAFVNSGDCSGVWPTSDSLRVGYRQLWFEDVDETKLEGLDAKFQAVLDSLLKGGGVEMRRMRDVVARSKRRVLAAVEDDPANTVVTPVLKHFLYADDPDDVDSLGEAADPLALLEMVEKVDADEWRSCLENLVGKSRICVLARPSKSSADTERDAEVKRVQETKEKFGDQGLQGFDDNLKAAVEINETPPSLEMLRDAVTPPDIREAVDKMFAVTHHQGKEEDTPQGGGIVDSVKGTQFCRVDLAASTKAVPARLRQYLPLLSELVFKAPCLIQGREVPYDEAVEELRRETVTYGAGWGLAGSGTADVFSVGAKLEKANASYGPKVARRALIEAKLDDTDRLNAATAKLSLAYSTDLRDGASVARMALRAAVFSPSDTNEGLLVAAAQRVLFDDVKKALTPWGALTGKKHHLIADLESLRASLFTQSNVVSRVAGDLDDDDARTVLAELSKVVDLAKQKQNTPVALIPTTTTTGTPQDLISKPIPWGRRVMVGVAALEGGSAYVARCAPGPGLRDVHSLAALSVIIEYLTALEGDFWTKIRGTGLAYGASLRTDPASNLVHFGLYRSADPAAALKAAARVVRGYARRETPLRAVDFENARGSLASGLISAEKTRSAALAGAWRRALLGLDHDRHVKFLKAVALVTEAQALDALDAYLVPLFKDALSVTALAGAPAKLNGFARDLKLDDDDQVVDGGKRNRDDLVLVPDVLAVFARARANPNLALGNLPFFANPALTRPRRLATFLKLALGSAAVASVAALAALALVKRRRL